MLLYPIIQNSVFAQDGTITGKVLDTNREPISYASIVFTDKRYGTYTNESGRFHLNYEDPADSIVVFALGFTPLKSTIQEILDHDNTVILKTDTLLVKETTVTPTKSKLVKRALGYFNSKLSYSYTVFTGSQIAVKIENPDLPNGSIIDQVHFKIKKVGNCHSPLRIRVLNIDKKTGRPGEDMVTDNIIITAGKLKSNIHVNFSEYQIIMPENGVYICIEWLKPEEDCINKKMLKNALSEKSVSPVLRGNQELKKVVTWTNYHNRSWSKKEKWSEREFQGNANIGLTVLVPKKVEGSH